ncbi:hypothetical protein MPH_03185 [Macrophomina phaseolina MS6]|uniref:Uncharacterized protein n=1 Tax=Macrophomina phaseolina (strain MS6) TaxID=1126212 RepID=K2S2S5_MACPH|nr:hypothetical protein MPH_03185 [Macrophomina phaseolina MS6]
MGCRGACCGCVLGACVTARRRDGRVPSSPRRSGPLLNVSTAEHLNTPRAGTTATAAQATVTHAHHITSGSLRVILIQVRPFIYINTYIAWFCSESASAPWKERVQTDRLREVSGLQGDDISSKTNLRKNTAK